MSGPSQLVGARKWGIRLDGCGPQLESLIKQQMAANPVTDFTLVEVGSAGCTTLRAFADIVATARLNGQTWRAVGLDLTPGKAWSLNWTEVAAAFTRAPTDGTHSLSDPVGTWPAVHLDLARGGMHLLLMDDPRSFLRNTFDFPIDVAFIDGCHGACAGRDFEAIEHKVREGGLVIFHDYGEAEQGSDWQSHCNEFINVRTYVHRLGLNQPCNTPRKGWRWVGEIKGSRHWGADGNSCAVVQRTKEALDPSAPTV